jgi:hypothetical protein
LRNGLGSDHWSGLDRNGKGRKKPARLAKSGTLTLLTNRWSQVSANLGVARSRPTSKLDFANVSTLAQVLRPPGCDTKSCRYQRSFFRSCPNPLLPILRPHGFSLCLLRSMRLRLNVRTQLPRFQRHQFSDSSAIERKPSGVPCTPRNPPSVPRTYCDPGCRFVGLRACRAFAKHCRTHA